VQVDPIKPKLKPPGTNHLKLKCDILLSTFALKFKLRRYSMAAYRTATRLFPGCHLPVLCIGMEYQRTNNLSLAEQFFTKVGLPEKPCRDPLNFPCSVPVTFMESVCRSSSA
jgi:hypothetical protein